MPFKKLFSTSVAIRKQNSTLSASGKREKSKIFPEQFVDNQATPAIFSSIP